MYTWDAEKMKPARYGRKMMVAPLTHREHMLEGLSLFSQEVMAVKGPIPLSPPKREVLALDKAIDWVCIWP